MLHVIEHFAVLMPHGYLVIDLSVWYVDHICNQTAIVAYADMCRLCLSVAICRNYTHTKLRTLRETTTKTYHTCEIVLTIP
jgi:hypothetical protein